MWIVEHLVNLTRDPTQYFALGNKIKQISEMSDYIKLGKEATTERMCYCTVLLDCERVCYCTVLSNCEIMKQWWWTNELCSQVKTLVLGQISVAVTLYTINCTQMGLGLNPGQWLTAWARHNTRIRRAYCSVCHIWDRRCWWCCLWTVLSFGMWWQTGNSVWEKCAAGMKSDKTVNVA
jgi:hypothetical protein